MKKALKILAFALVAAAVAGFSACNHRHRFITVEERDPTCLTDGFRRMKCADCGEEKEETLYALGHEYSIYNVCTRCGYELEPTGKLAYLETEDGEAYNVALGSSTSKNIVIEAYHLGKPVVGILTEGFASLDTEEDTETPASLIESIEIPDGVVSIGDRAFYGCASLTTLSLPRNSLKTIGDLAFRGCSALGSFNNVRGLESIGANAFARCESLTTLPDMPNLRKVGDFAFTDCTKLTRAYLGGSLEALGKGAFYRCSLLQSAFLGRCASIGENTFGECGRLEEVVVPRELGKIDGAAFTDCTALKSIRYGGTMEEWKNLTKAADWFVTHLDPEEFVDYYVYCTDGTLDRNGVIAEPAGA